MGNLKSSSAPMLVSASLIDEWSHLLPESERSVFVRECTEAGADDELLQAILARYFSAWKTSLMGDDLSRLQLLARYMQIRDYVKVIRLEDDWNEYLSEMSPSESLNLWPRHEDGEVKAEALWVGLLILKNMLATQQLRPDKLEILDKQSTNACADPETAALLLRKILDGTDLALTALSLSKGSPNTAVIAAELSAEHQGQGKGFSMLRKATICLGYHQRSSYWADEIMAAPELKVLSLSFWRPSVGVIDGSPPTILANYDAWPSLERLELSSLHLSTPVIMAFQETRNRV